MAYYILEVSLHWCVKKTLMHDSVNGEILKKIDITWVFLFFAVYVYYSGVIFEVAYGSAISSTDAQDFQIKVSISLVTIGISNIGQVCVLKRCHCAHDRLPSILFVFIQFIEFLTNFGAFDIFVSISFSGESVMILSVSLSILDPGEVITTDYWDYTFDYFLLGYPISDLEGILCTGKLYKNSPFFLYIELNNWECPTFTFHEDEDKDDLIIE